MITYVNTVLVGNLGSSELWTPSNGHLEPEITDAGKFIVATADEAGGMVVNEVVTPYVDASTAAIVSTIKVGVITNKTAAQVNPHTGVTKNVPIVKWSHIIKQDAIKSYTAADYAADTEDNVYIEFGSMTDIVGGSNSAAAGKRIIVRLTFKDMPHRFRKWTESYEYITSEGDTKAKIAENIAKMINKEYKRARVIASVGSINTTSASADATIPGSTTKYFHTDSNWGTDSATSGTVVRLEAMKYDDDDSVDSLNWYAKVRFNANIYWTNPAAEGWESLNKNYPKGVTITKVSGKTYQGSAKLVRDREAQAMGYLGILNHGEGTWPIIQPAMTTVLTNHYKTITVEFENMYRTADDLQRRTKEAVEIYAVANSNLKAVLDAFIVESGEIATALAGKVDKVDGKGLSANDYTDADKAKVDALS